MYEGREGGTDVSERLGAIMKSVQSIQLSENERRFLVWLAGWEPSATDNFISIARKLEGKEVRM